MNAPLTVASLAPRALKRLSADHCDQYGRDGYTIFRGQTLKPERFASLKAHFENLLANLGPEQRPENMDVPHFLDTQLFTWLFDQDLLDLVEDIIGPDIALFSSHFLCKPAGDGKRVPWHEDSSYWRGQFAEGQMEVVTIWLAIDSSDSGNSAMKVIPGTHLGRNAGYSPYIDVQDPGTSVFPTEISASAYDHRRAVMCELEVNQCSLHHAKLMHGSDYNRSDRRRCGYTMRYVSTRSRWNHEQNPHHQLYLARGRDHAGNQYGDPSKPAPALLAARASAGIKKGH